MPGSRLIGADAPPYVEESRFMTRTDQKSFERTLDIENSTSSLALWRRLVDFDTKVQHRPGRKQVAVGALSWLPINQTDNSDFDDDITAYVVVKSHEEPDDRNRNEHTLLTVQRFLATQRGVTHCRHLVKSADAPDILFLYNKFCVP